MQKKIILLSLLALFCLTPGFAAEDPTEATENIAEETVGNAVETGQIPVLMYHHILPESMMDDLPYNAALISFESFKAQMGWLKDEGWTALSLEAFYNALNSEEPLPEKAFVLTFDDGYASNLFFAFPTLNRYNFSATEFVITANLEEDTRKWDGKKLSWKDATFISKLFSIQSHSHNFHQMEGDLPYLAVKTKEEIREDLDFAWAEIDRHIEPGFRAFAYPYGAFTETAIDVLKEQNVQLAFTTAPGYATKDSNLLLIPRFSITPSVSMEEFQSIFLPSTAEDESESIDAEPIEPQETQPEQLEPPDATPVTETVIDPEINEDPNE